METLASTASWSAGYTVWSLGGVFFGESMFSRARDASKVALVHLVARLRLGGYRLLDTQFVTTHLSQFGAIEIPRALYKSQLVAAIGVEASWLVAPPADALDGAIRALGHRAEARPAADGAGALP